MRHVLHNSETGEVALVRDAPGRDPLTGYGEKWAIAGRHEGDVPHCARWCAESGCLVTDEELAARQDALAQVRNPARLRGLIDDMMRRIEALEGKRNGN